jgi:hypothetical protein
MAIIGASRERRIAWESRSGGGRNVRVPARQYAVNGERRRFATLRPVVDATSLERVRNLVLRASADYEESGAEAVSSAE